MPANLPPEYYEAEKRFKAALCTREKVAALEALIATVPKHKGTDKLRADLRRRLSRLRDESARQKKKGGRGDLYAVPSVGAAQFALVGFANAGKSALVSALTNAEPTVADYPMSTVMPLSGMMPYEDIQFQLVDLPPAGNEATDGWVSGVVRAADGVLLVIDLSEEPGVQAELLLELLSSWNIPLGSGEPEGKKSLVAAGKMDVDGAARGLEELRKTLGESAGPVVGVSALKRVGLEELRRKVFEVSGLLRVYTKQPGKGPDMNVPFTLPRGSTVMDLADLVHKDFLRNLRYACIWGSARFPGQRVQKSFQLSDGDVVELHT
ncbi:MAG: TGS domain-containing protein [Nitrospirota bacterium]|jgi:ribosome-interacting GTPase 1